MQTIATQGAIVTVTPGDELQIIYRPGEHEFIDDRSPFTMRVEGTLEESGQIIGVFGPVISGHPRYQNLTATLLVRCWGSDWRRDNTSGANFKVGPSVARRVASLPFYHPDGTEVQGFPIIIRFGSINSRAADEEAVNSALNPAP